MISSPSVKTEDNELGNFVGAPLTTTKSNKKKHDSSTLRIMIHWSKLAHLAKIMEIRSIDSSTEQYWQIDFCSLITCLCSPQLLTIREKYMREISNLKVGYLIANYVPQPISYNLVDIRILYLEVKVMSLISIISGCL